MRTPLQTIVQFLNMLTSLIESQHFNLPKQYVDPVKKYYGFMNGQINLTLTFVEDLLDMKQLKEGAFGLSLQPFDPKEVLQLIEAIFQPSARNKRIDLSAVI